MSVPFFYAPSLHTGPVVLDEDTSKHITGVLRMKAGEQLVLTDGKGARATAVIADDHRKKCVVQIDAVRREMPASEQLTIAISPVKNNARFEWFLEKATEIGVQEIIPLICDRTIREKFRHDRMNNIIVSAMLQSQQCFMPQLRDPVSFQELARSSSFQNKFIAHCLPQEKHTVQGYALQQKNIMLIGPEGDFSENEILMALQNGFIPVTLGSTRLRTETAGIAAAVLLSSMRRKYGEV